DKNGALQISLPTNSSFIKIYFEETSSVLYAQWVSAILWLILLFWAFFQIKKFYLFSSNEDNPKNVNNKIYDYVYKFLALSQTKYAWLLLVFFSVLSLSPMIFIGVYKGVDLVQHSQFATTFQSAISAGDFYPSWAANENLGYGGLGVRFYPPLTPFVGALFRIISGDWHTATWLTFLFFTLIGSFGVYLWAREFMSESKSIWAGVIFTFMPYRLIEIQNGSQYAEFAGCSVIIFSFLFVTRICRKDNWLDVIGLAISYAILIFTHLPLTVIGSLALFLYAITLLDRNKILSKLIKLSLSVFLGLTASSIYWLKMVAEMSWLHKINYLDRIDFDYNFNFLLTSPWDDNRHYWFLNFVLLTLFVSVLSLMFSLYQQRDEKLNVAIRAVAVVFFFSILMTTVLSQPIWSVIPFLGEVQFPSRWLAIASFSGSILLVEGIGSILKLSGQSVNWKKTIQVWGGVVFVCYVLILSLVIIEFQLNYIPSQNFEAWMIEKSHEMGSDFFWTPNTKAEAFELREKVIVERNNLNILDWQLHERIFSVDAGKETNARIATLFYPHWHATVNNQPTDLKVADDGSILVPLPTEKATVKIWFEEPFRVKLATYISAATWLVFVLSLLFLLTQKKFTAFNSNQS
ncbi:MAG: 6-pyruvoyl-tetrahydropterin synthase-related protein, partial [Actinomycetota bacterium]